MIVGAFDPVNDVEPRFGTGFVAELMDALDFQGLEEALHRRIVPAVGPATHRLLHPEILEQLPVAITGVLTAAIRMHDQPGRWFAAPIGRLQCLTDQVGMQSVAQLSTSVEKNGGADEILDYRWR